MRLEENVSFVLRYGAMIGIIIVSAGLLIDLAGLECGRDVMTAGIAAIVFTPFAGMIISFVTLSVTNEKRYAIAALALIAISVAGMLVAFWLR